ncbi:MAG: hypothetical protein HYU37_19070 [Acidobacteria bacterium]|nr:hypothetical protein [Acidobacteriota bacterium]
MPQANVSPPVRAFVAAHARTLDELQLLMAIIQSADRSWDASAAAREVGLAEADARAALEHLAACNLLDIRIGENLRYQFRPGTPQLREAALSALEAYRQRPLDIARLVQPEHRSLRDFADAFRIRHDDDR